MITDKDLQKLMVAMANIFVTKEEANKTEERIIDTVRDMNSKVYNLVDKVIKELRDMRDEQAAHRVEHDDTNKRLDGIESIPAIAHELNKKKN